MSAISQADQAQRFAKVVRIVEDHDRNPARIISIMQAIQDEYRYLPEEVLTAVSSMLDISPAKVFGIATFYSHFSLEPKGRYILRVCDGTACHVRGSGAIINALREKLNLSEKKNTTGDMLFTLETVSCLGACGLAPVLVVNEKVHGQVKPEQALALVDEIIAQEAENE